MNTKRIGNIGEAKVITWFVEHNIPVYLPFGDNERCDLIAEFNNKLNKIQVKTATGNEASTICGLYSATSSPNNKEGNKYKQTFYSEDEIDYFALYNIKYNAIYLIDINTIRNRHTITIRHNVPKNKVNTIIYDKDVLIDVILSKFNNSN